MKTIFYQTEVFEKWKFPTTIENVRKVVESLPTEDVEGLYSVGLVQSDRATRHRNGVYYFQPKPDIKLYTYPFDLRYKQPATVKLKHVELHQRVEIEFGMKIRLEGSRLICAWESAELERFILFHVLLHEVGHYVFHSHWELNGLKRVTNRVSSEQFAEAYALRMHPLCEVD